MYKSKTFTHCNSLSFMMGSVVGILAGHSDTLELFSARHLLLIIGTTAVFFIVQNIPQLIKKGSR